MSNPIHRSDIVKHNKPALINWVAAIFAANGTLLFGYDSGIISSVISANYDQFQTFFGDASGKVGSSITGAIVSVFAGGAFSDKIGRKRTIQLGSLIAIVGCVLQTAAVNVAMLILGRAIAGIAIGVLSMIVPMYQAEISPPHVRGLMSGWTQQMISVGFFLANWVGYGCQYIRNHGQFRVPLALQNIPAIILFFGMFFLPYSPRWLAKQGRRDEAKAALFRLHGGRKNARPEIVEAEFAEMQLQIEWERENLATNFKDLFNTRPNLHRTVCGILVQAMTQWTGVNVNKYVLHHLGGAQSGASCLLQKHRNRAELRSYYGPTIFGNLGFSGQDVLLIQGLSGAWGLICNFIFIHFIVDRLGRRMPLIIGAGLLACCVAWQAGCSSAFETPGYSNRSTGIAGIASIFVFSLVFSMSYGPVSWIYQSEIFPTNLRALGASASTASNWLNNVIISQVTPSAFANIRYKYFFVFMSTNISNCVVAYMLFPETKNRTLEEIGLLFGDTNVRVQPTLEDTDGATLAERETHANRPDGGEKGLGGVGKGSGKRHVENGEAIAV